MQSYANSERGKKRFFGWGKLVRTALAFVGGRIFCRLRRQKIRHAADLCPGFRQGHRSAVSVREPGDDPPATVREADQPERLHVHTYFVSLTMRTILCILTLLACQPTHARQAG